MGRANPDRTALVTPTCATPGPLPVLGLAASVPAAMSPNPAPLSFNTTGTCIPGKHYMLPPGPRLIRVMELIEQEKYFVFYAGHQTGKTTCAKWLADHYNQEGRYASLWVDLENAREQPDLDRAVRTILKDLDDMVRLVLPDVAPPSWSAATMDPATAVTDYLRALCALVPRPLVLFLDEADGLVGPAMVSFLTQLRAGYLARDRLPFPPSIVLIGRRQIRDYSVTQQERRTISWLGTTSPFNITAESVPLGPFTEDEVRALLLQHTAATGQVFEEGAVDRVFFLSQGHPWLVNALAAQVVERDVRDRSVAVTAAHVDAAKETIILERRSHIDALISRLHEERVARILQPMLIGEHIPSYDELNDDFAYVLGLGIISRQGNRYGIANPIYREVIPRVLSFDQQVQLMVPAARYVGLVQLGEYLDLSGLAEGWLVIFDRRKARSWKERLTLRQRKAGGHRIFVVGC